MSAPLVLNSPKEAIESVGSSLGPSEWLEIDQKRIDMFAEATGDHQWIHVDPERAARGPFGKTIAHGYLTFSLINFFLPQLLRAEGLKMGVNYGADRLRFPAPVPVGSRLRGVGEVVKAEPIGEDAAQITVRMTIEVEGSERPGCVADIIARFYYQVA